ncbi:MAG TPA: ribosome-associated translation inhibitor RaiA [Thermodesulfobacteriota bacterium]|jgi:putative sigma-54 modulation protein
MQVTVTTRHIEQSKAEHLRTYILKKIKRVERYIKTGRNPSEVKVVLAVEKFRNIAEIFLNSGTLKTTSNVEDDSMHSAIDKAVDSIIKQLKRLTEKKIRTQRRAGTRSKGKIISPRSQSSSTKEDDFDNVTIEKTQSKPMSVEEAVLQLRISGMDFLMFLNSESGKINVLYKKGGGGLGLVTSQ